MEEGEIGNRDKRGGFLSSHSFEMQDGTDKWTSPLGNLSTERRDTLFFSVKRERYIYIYIPRCTVKRGCNHSGEFLSNSWAFLSWGLFESLSFLSLLLFFKAGFSIYGRIFRRFTNDTLLYLFIYFFISEIVEDGKFMEREWRKVRGETS